MLAAQNMTRPTRADESQGLLSEDLRRGLGVRRATRLSRVSRSTRLPPEALLDLALDLLETLNRHLASGTRSGNAIVTLANERWKHTSPEERSKALRHVALARWSRRRPRQSKPLPVDS